MGAPAADHPPLSLVRVFEKDGEGSLDFKNVKRLSFCDAETHGNATLFNIQGGGRTLVVSSPNIVAVEVEA